MTSNSHGLRLALVHIKYSWILLVIGLLVTTQARADTLHHELQVTLQPAEAVIMVTDQIQLPINSMDSTDFILRSSLSVTAHGANLTLTGESEQGRLRHYRLNRLPPNRKVQLSYQGTIATDKTDMFGMPKYLLSQDSVYLDGVSAWLPQFNSYPRVTFNLQVTPPPGWEMISQGRRNATNDGFRFTMLRPQDDVYLLGGPFKRYQQMLGDIELVVYLREADAQLAQRYLETAAHYVRFYSELIGPFPYAKFAVVENRWQTGYGMPSFTLLGSRVIRLPFILHTSLPHEILHNYWGNGVFVDYTHGNWSEGLTAYLSDHLVSEQRGKDIEYRRKALEAYTNFAAHERDFALVQFRSRHSDASQAVGYSKSLMLFHMLRQRAGDNDFEQRIKDLWQNYQFQTASYTDVIQALFKGSKKEYETFVAQWLNRAGAPKLALGKAQVKEHASGYRLTLEVIQEQTAPPYIFQLPLEVKLADVEAPARRNVNISARRSHIALEFEQRPQAVKLDPNYDVFRLLDPKETPASLGRLFGARKQLLVLPTRVSPEERKAWQQLAAAWSKRFQNVEQIDDNKLKRLPTDAAVWLLGWQNSLLSTGYSRFSSATQQLQSNTATINEQQLTITDHAVVLLDPDNSRSPLGFIGAAQPEAITLLARKLPHYKSYGRLAFDLPEVTNIIKQHMPVKVSPLSRQLDN